MNAEYDWFWRGVPPRMEASAERVDALQIVREAMIRRGGSSIGERAEAVALRWRNEISVAAHAARVSEALIVAIVAVESAGRASAVSPVGAEGLGQLMPTTAMALGVRDSFDPGANLRGAALYISDLIDMFSGDLVLALAGYNAGENAVIRHMGVPPYRETRAYVPKVLEAYVAVSSTCEGGSSANVRQACVLPSAP